jgi:hypothetical protein
MHYLKLQRRIGITKVEEELNKHNSKSCRIEKFKNIDAKLKANEVLVPLYKNVSSGSINGILL